MHTLVTKEGFPYGFEPNACATCGGRCCTGESGYIYVNKTEMERLAQFLDISIEDLKKKYLYKSGYRYSIKEKEDETGFACIFFDSESKGCLVYGARPLQCRTFPFWEYYKNRVEELKEECPGIVDV